MASILVIEDAAEEAVSLPAGVMQIDRRAYGDTQVIFAAVRRAG